MTLIYPCCGLPPFARQAKDLLQQPGLTNTREGILLKQRIEDCEQAAALASRGSLTLPKRDLCLNVKKILSKRKVLPNLLKLELSLRHAHDLFKQAVGDLPRDGDESEDAIFKRLLESLVPWKAFMVDEQHAPFDPLQPSFTALAASLCDEMVVDPGEEGDEQPEGSQEAKWKAGWVAV